MGGSRGQFTSLTLEEREMKLLLTGECDQVRRHQETEDLEVLELHQTAQVAVSGSYVTKLKSILTLVCFSMR